MDVVIDFTVIYEALDRTEVQFRLGICYDFKFSDFFCE